VLAPRYHRIDAWPPLAWVAECSRRDRSVEIRHGPRVEVRDSWFCEAVWDGAHAAGDFDRTDLVFGSGGRRREDGWVFVSAGSTVDRLHALAFEDGVRVSNTLPGLMEVADATFDPADGRYYAALGSIVRGIDDYVRFLPTSRGPLQLAYFHNLRWDGERLTGSPKPDPRRDFSSFERYRDFLLEATGRIVANLRDRDRDRPFGMIGSVSSGYDSPTVAVLARAAGLEQVFTVDRARSGEDDRGAAIAERLGLAVTVIGRDDWREEAFAEAPFLAADAKGEDVALGSAGALLDGRVLFTGFHGGRVWSRSAEDLRPCLARKDRSGLSLSEVRLWKGFVHAPLAYLGARQIADIHALGTSPALARWDVPGDYSKPVCRRIVEEAGVPREWFGMRKKAASTLFREGVERFTDEGERDFERWLREHRRAWWSRGRVPPDRVRAAADRLAPLHGAAVTALRGLARGRLHERAGALADLVADLRRGTRFSFPWAVERARRRYRDGGGPA